MLVCCISYMMNTFLYSNYKMQSFKVSTYGIYTYNLEGWYCLRSFTIRKLQLPVHKLANS